MNDISKDIFKAVFENKWISIEYCNKDNETTKYWIGIKKILFKNEVELVVDGFHVALCTVQELKIKLNRIKSSRVIETSYFDVPSELKEDITINQHKYQALFNNVPNLKILNYLTECNRLDSVPYKCEYSLIDKIDDVKIDNECVKLSDEQFRAIVSSFQAGSKDNNITKTKQICMNILSINTKKGLYVLAYRDLFLDVKNKQLSSSSDITICNEFSIDGTKESIRYFLDADDLELLDDFKNNLQIIEDRIIASSAGKISVDDMPYLIAIGRDCVVDLNKEYSTINRMYEDNKVTTPIKAFFGELTKQPIRKKNYTITLIDKRINLDQLLAIHNAVKYPLTYVQGPPGTGKTNTIINTILTSFFNQKTLLFASYNNHPIDSVFERLSSIKYKDNDIPFPILRLGNNEKVLEATQYIKDLYEKVKDKTVYSSTLEKYEGSLVADDKLTELMQKNEELIELKERKETIEKLLESTDNFNFQVELSTNQLNQINQKIKEIGEVKNEELFDMLPDNDDLLKKYMNYTSIDYIKRLAEPKYESLLRILDIEDEDERITEFNRYISNPNNFDKLLKVFPIVCTTCLSAAKLSEPSPIFDLVVMDEASQCNTAVSLIPIIRGKNLLLVGDPQQLNPVILLDKKTNEVLRKKYNISDEYDYIDNSIYKTFLSCDCVSQEILLSHHYRCDKKIIGFCNKKYYNNKLSIDTASVAEKPLVYVDVKNNESDIKNASYREASQIVKYVKTNKDKKIGIITPFVNQKEMINQLLAQEGIDEIKCGTVHAFQGDEKDEIIFSLSITNRTGNKTYGWLKNNKELINVAVSRARNKLIILGNDKDIDRLHTISGEGRDDIYELVQYAKNNGNYEVSTLDTKSRALGIKPYSTETEEAFLLNINHALGNILKSDRKCTVKKEVSIAQVFSDNYSYNDLFYTGRFDFVVYEKDIKGRDMPIFAIELDGKEHYDNEVVKARDAKKNAICKEHGFDLIRIDNTYARRYNYMKEILIKYFSSN